MNMAKRSWKSFPKWFCEKTYNLMYMCTFKVITIAELHMTVLVCLCACRYNGGEGYVPGAMFKRFDKRQATVYVKKVSTHTQIQHLACMSTHTHTARCLYFK